MSGVHFVVCPCYFSFGPCLLLFRCVFCYVFCCVFCRVFCRVCCCASCLQTCGWRSDGAVVVFLGVAADDVAAVAHDVDGADIVAADVVAAAETTVGADAPLSAQSYYC